MTQTAVLGERVIGPHPLFGAQAPGSAATPIPAGLDVLASDATCPPFLRPRDFSGAMQAAWPEFMQHDASAELFFGRRHLDACIDNTFAVVESARPDVVVGRTTAVPFAFADVPGRTELPHSGWDRVIRRAQQDRVLGQPADALSAFDIMLLPSHRGRGACRAVLDALRKRAAALGYRHLFAPARPSAKHLEPFTSMAGYVARLTADGLPADPWLRVHVRAGGEIVKVAPKAW